MEQKRIGIPTIDVCYGPCDREFSTGGNRSIIQIKEENLEKHAKLWKMFLDHEITIIKPAVERSIYDPEYYEQLKIFC